MGEKSDQNESNRIRTHTHTNTKVQRNRNSYLMFFELSDQNVLFGISYAVAMNYWVLDGAWLLHLPHLCIQLNV